MHALNTLLFMIHPPVVIVVVVVSSRLADFNYANFK